MENGYNEELFAHCEEWRNPLKPFPIGAKHKQNIYHNLI